MTIRRTFVLRTQMRLPQESRCNKYWRPSRRILTRAKIANFTNQEVKIRFMITTIKMTIERWQLVKMGTSTGTRGNLQLTHAKVGCVHGNTVHVQLEYTNEIHNRRPSPRTLIVTGPVGNTGRHHVGRNSHWQNSLS